MFGIASLRRCTPKHVRSRRNYIRAIREYLCDKATPTKSFGTNNWNPREYVEYEVLNFMRSDYDFIDFVFILINCICHVLCIHLQLQSLVAHELKMYVFIF